MTTPTITLGRLFTPGSHDARARGCRCSAVQNAYGRGHGDYEQPIFVIEKACAMHQHAVAHGYSMGAIRTTVTSTRTSSRPRDAVTSLAPKRDEFRRRRPAQFQQKQCACGRWFTPIGGNQRRCTSVCAA